MKFKEEHIIDYIEGKLDASTSEMLKQELEQNPKLREIYKAQRLVHEALEFHQDQSLKKTFSQWNAEINKKDPQIIEKQRPFLRRHWMAMAASFIIIAGVAFLLTSRSIDQDELFAMYYSEPQPNRIRAGKNTTEVSDSIDKGLTFHAQQNWKKAADIFEQVDTQDPQYSDAVLMHVDALIHLDDLSGAQQLIRNALDHGKINDSTSDQLEWTIALLHLKNRDHDTALEMLNKIAQNESHMYRVMAKELVLKVR